jgi:membrane-bound lytic murein transglycosylase B
MGTIVDGRAVEEIIEALDGWLADDGRRSVAAGLGPAQVMPWSWASIAVDFDRIVADLADLAGGPASA